MSQVTTGKSMQERVNDICNDLYSKGEKLSVRIVLAEMVTFLNKAQILKELNRVPNDAALLIDASKTTYI